MLAMLSKMDVSFKTIESPYSDPEVMLAIHNLHILLFEKKGITESNITGDGTGYSLTVKKNYESYAQELKDKAKENRNDDKGKKSAKKRKTFAYSFRLMDLRTKMYMAFGSSMKSEKEAFDRAMMMLSYMDVDIDTARLDSYYSNHVYVDMCGGKVYIIPKLHTNDE